MHHPDDTNAAVILAVLGANAVVWVMILWWSILEGVMR